MTKENDLLDYVGATIAALFGALFLAGFAALVYTIWVWALLPPAPKCY
jgi:hypothetical protein